MVGLNDGGPDQFAGHAGIKVQAGKEKSTLDVTSGSEAAWMAASRG